MKRIAKRDQQLEAAQRDLRNRSEELDTLTLAEKTSTSEHTQRQDEVVRQRDNQMLRAQSNASKPVSNKLAATASNKRGKSQ